MSLRNILAREMLNNILMHREFSSSYAAKFVIEQERMYVENANRAVREGKITPDNLEPNPKNPIIASFFRNIGRADRLGSGVRNLFKYSKFYSGQEPQFIEGDVFQIMVPLDTSFSYDFGSDVSKRNNKMPTIVKEVSMSADNCKKSADNKYSKQEKMVLQYIEEKGKITTKEAEKLLSVKERRARSILAKLVKEKILLKQRSYRSVFYVKGE